MNFGPITYNETAQLRAHFLLLNGDPAALKYLLDAAVTGPGLQTWLATPVNLAAFQQLLSAPAGAAAICASATAMAAVAASSTALGQVKNSPPALTAINASNTAKTALLNSALKTTVTKVASGWEQPRVFVATGTGLFVRMLQPSAPGGNGVQIDGGYPGGVLGNAADIFSVTKFATRLGADRYDAGTVMTYIVC